MVKIFKHGLTTQNTIAVFYDDPAFGSLSCYLPALASQYFRASLSDEQKQILDEKGCLVVHREQFSWLPIETSDGVPDHEKKNLDEWVAKTAQKI